MERLDHVIDERVSFLEEQISPQNKPLVNRALEIQIETIRNAGTGNIALQILQKQKHHESAIVMNEIERLYPELEALDRLQRQVVKHF